MNNDLAKKLKRFKNLPDYNKIEILDALGKEQKNSTITDFLINAFETEKYFKIRIKAVMVLARLNDQEIAQKLSEFYAYERDRNVRLAITEALGEMEDIETDEMLKNILKNDLNDVVRAAALRQLHERKKLKKIDITQLLLDVIKNDSETFPKQIALSLLPSYSTQTVYDTLKNCYYEEDKFKMKSLMFKTLTEVASTLNKEVDVEEPKKPQIESIEKKKRKKKKKNKEPEEYLYF